MSWPEAFFYSVFGLGILAALIIAMWIGLKK